MNVDVKPVMGYLDHLVMARPYKILKPGRAKSNVCLRNHNAKQITLPKWPAVGEIEAENVIPALLATRPTGNESAKGEATTQKRGR